MARIDAAPFHVRVVLAVEASKVKMRATVGNTAVESPINSPESGP
jgi:hypothetical protein